MDKYSLKIINFINKIKDSKELIKYDMSKKINVNHNLITEIKKIIHDILKYTKKIEVNKVNILNKLHDNDYPLLYLFFREYNKIDSNISVDTYKDFLKWFILNQHEIDYDEIFNKIKSNKKLVDLFNTTFQKNKSREMLHNFLHDNTYVGLDTIHYSEITDLQNILIENDDTMINIYADISYDKDKLNNNIKNILNIIAIMHKINKEIIKSKQNKLNLNILLGKQKKYIYETDIMTPININSGSSLRGKYVNIWREEELEKVLIHEIQHFYNCDFHAFDNGYNELSNFIKQTFSINGDDKVNESINEVMAIIIHMIYQSIKLNIDLSIIYSYEMYFTMFQIAKIIVFYGGTSYDSLFRNNENYITFKQTTSVLSYYVIKGLFLFNINETLDFLYSNQLKCSDKDDIKKLKIYIEKIINNTDNNTDNNIIDIVNTIIPAIQELDKSKFIWRTMRMSAVS
jgi:hypothetical protein